ncbi:MAG: S-layer homology domain-containing protein [Clostridia bacterium]|nr:S-layer homology domain-containing protein [Clostridia bacterium]
MAKSIKRMFALILAVSMVMSLSVNAFAIDGTEPVCGKDEHTHGETCYEQTLICEEDTNPLLICEITDETHEHADGCFVSHAHGDDCFESALICEIEAHIHGEDCFAAQETEEAVSEETVTEAPIVIEETPANETLVAVEGVACIDGIGFETLEEAIEAANADDETEGAVVIELLEDVVLDKNLSIARDITLIGEFTVMRGTAGTLFTVNKDASLTLDGGVIIDGGNNWTFDGENFYADMAAGLTLSTGAKNSYTEPEEGGIVATAAMIAVKAKGEVVMNEATIQNSWGSPLFSIPAGAVLTTNDDSVIRHIRSGHGGAVAGQLSGLWVMEGGLIEDVFGHNTNGGIVDIRDSGVVTINDGEITDIRTLGLKSNSNGILAQVYGEKAKLNINGGYIHDNASFAPGNGWGSVVYLNRGGDFTMTGGTIEATVTDHCSAFVANTPTTIELLGGTMEIDPSLVAWFDTMIYGDVTVGEDMEIIGTEDSFFAMLGDKDYTLNIDGEISGDGLMWLMYNQPVTGDGTVTSDVLVKADPDYFEHDGKVIIAEANWLDSLITVDSIGSDASLTVKKGAVIDGVQVRVLDSVSDGDCTNADEAAAAQKASYIEEKGADVDSPVLFFHRLTAAQKQNIVVTYDYNGGLDACNWSGTQVTTDGESYIPSEEELARPTRDGYILAGWAYAEDNDPECLEMDADGAYNGEAITESLRLVAQWERIVYTVNYQYIGNVPGRAPALPETEEYAAGDEVEIADEPEMDGYVFYGWKDTSESLEDGIMPNCNVILTGYWLAEESDVEPPLGLKTDEEIEDLENTYEVKIEVPGNAEVQHDEVIIMMDGSYSGDEEWPAARAAILEIGNAVLDGTGHTKLSLMAFGMADNMVLEHIETIEELTERLPEGGLPGGLLYGRSSTNCEAGFTGVAQYMISDEQLNEAYVIYISDGNVNTDETPRDFDTNWKTWTKFGALAVAQETFGGTVSNGRNLPEAFETVFGDRFDGASAEEIIARAFGGEVSEEEFLAFADQVWADVYDYSDMIPGAKYPISDVEIAFVKYDKEHGTYIQDLFYYTTYKSGYVTYPNRFARAAEAGTELASMVDKLYLIDVDGKSNWMDPATSGNSSTNVVGDNVSFTNIKDFANFSEAFASALEELSVTGYKNVVVTDYMSKWVNLDTDTVRVVNDTTGETVWSALEGWLVDENRPTAQEIPVIIEMVAPAGYEDGGEDVVGNQSGDIYKLTWFVKDDALLRTDTYSLRYTVTVDTEEDGFVAGKDYPANGKTTVSYEDEEDDEQEDEIEVPDVSVPGYTVTYINGDEVLEQYTGLKTGDKIPGYEGDTPVSAGKKFDGWDLNSGKPVNGSGKETAKGKFIGTTDLVYIATFKSKTNITPGNPEEEIIIDEDIPLAEIPALFGSDHYAYIIGRDDGLVHPEANITRAEVATIFFRLLAEEVRTAMMTGENDFTDVEEGQWYNHAVSTLASMGIVFGRGDGTYYDPDAFITRAEFAAIAARFDPMGNPEGVFFSDISGHWAEKEIIIAANNGWVEGYNGLFRPDDYITRAEAMTLINRVLHRLPETEHDLLDYMIIWPDNMDTEAWYYLAVQEATNSHFYERKENPEFETWTEFREPYDWSLLEY